MASNLPPKSVRSELIRRDPRAGELERRRSMDGRDSQSVLAALRRRGPVELKDIDEPLPVLQAFQDFLEAERARTRARILAILFLFSMLLIAVIGGGLLLGFVFHGRVQKDFARMQNEVAAARRASGDAAERAGVLQQATDRLARSVATDQERMAAIQTQVVSNARNYEALLTDFGKVVASLETENEGLRRDLDTILQDWSAMTNRVAHAESAAARSTLVASLIEEATPLTYQTPRHSTLEITLPTGDGRDVPWLVPIPE